MSVDLYLLYILRYKCVSDVINLKTCRFRHSDFICDANWESIDEYRDSMLGSTSCRDVPDTISTTVCWFHSWNLTRSTNHWSLHQPSSGKYVNVLVCPK